MDGSGKTTQTALLVRALEEVGREVVRLREPGGTAISEQIREILLDPTNSAMCDECELLLYEASRAQLVREVVEPALAAGKVVVCDRYYDSTYAYQAGGRGLADDLVRRANVLGSCGRVPDVTVVFDIEPRNGADRLEAAGLSFQEKVRAAYLRLAAEEPARVRTVDADGTIDEVNARLCAALADVLPELR